MGQGDIPNSGEGTVQSGPETDFEPSAGSTSPAPALYPQRKGHNFFTIGLQGIHCTYE
ncbi:hypothetical protein SBA5_300035 [Candidatus Sulfotelmatomonas gaucii]|uniref:Uncharacterized protein n=1 Tax=Candidatus Sulfuritelmatomonas gaucii TaxID=2043161 RepID=A0A2N9LDN9_9BACT|nr:hypothetical protein SBA5_300035 [Candidatus Sulfotelmatomonas gaucii]